jgi:hypothetical protein
VNNVSCFDSIYAVVGGLHDFDSFRIFDTAGIVCAAYYTKHSRLTDVLTEEQAE